MLDGKSGGEKLRLRDGFNIGDEHEGKVVGSITMGRIKKEDIKER